jgi:ArsR family transcriptional regulator, arsenate/arsenite/antimonite-responsive transcriptional repressor
VSGKNGVAKQVNVPNEAKRHCAIAREVDQPPSEAIVVLRALADPNRLRIFELLMQGDSCNCELNEKLGLPANLLSHHLRVLREAGLVSSRRDAIDGRWIYYAVDRNAVARWRQWFGRLFDPARIPERATLCGPEGMLPAAGKPAVSAGLMQMSVDDWRCW